ncbi:MAG: hypothetical protein AB7H53_19210 [Hyphomicrobium sp.]
MSSGGVVAKGGRRIVLALAVVIGFGWVVKYWVWPFFLSVLPTLAILLGVGAAAYGSFYLLRRRRQRLGG